MSVIVDTFHNWWNRLRQPIVCECAGKLLGVKLRALYVQAKASSHCHIQTGTREGGQSC
jgi:hypothetical protein